MPQKQPRNLQHSEVEKLFAAVDETVSPFKLLDKTILMFMYYTGVRVAELVNVRSEDVDNTSGFIKIVKCNVLFNIILATLATDEGELR